MCTLVNLCTNMYSSKQINKVTKMNNALKSAFESLTKEQQEKVMIAYMKNPEEAFNVIWESLQNNAA